MLDNVKLLYHYFTNKELYYWSERKVRGGNLNPNKKIYIIRRNAPKVGLFSYYITVAANINIALKNGYIPVVDMTSSNPYLKPSEYNKVNAWDFYFEQPMNISMEEAYKSRNIVLSFGYPVDFMPSDSMDFFNNIDGIKDYWKDICHKYIRLKKEVIDFIDQKQNEAFHQSDRILGVLYRGTDYAALKPKNHPVQPTIDETIKKAYEVCDKYNCNKIYLSTEDKSALDRFKSEFKDKVITFQKNYIEYKTGYISDSITNDVDVKQVGLEYLTNIVMLSRCNCLIAGRTSGTVGAALMSDKFDYEYYWDLGVY